MISEFVEDEFGTVGVRLNKKYGVFINKGIPVIADCVPSKKTTKNVPEEDKIKQLVKLVNSKETRSKVILDIENEISWLED